jgi:hypothetical protein
MSQTRDEKGAKGAKGVVYVFNTTSLGITVTLNGNALKDIDPAGSDGTPSALPVPRSDATSIGDPVFAGTNSLQVMFSGIPNIYGTLKIDPVQYSTNKNLALYLFYGYLVLVDLSTNAIVQQMAHDKS